MILSVSLHVTLNAAGFKRFVRLCVSVAMILSVSLHVTLNAAGFRQSVGRGGSAAPVMASRRYTAGSAA